MDEEWSETESRTDGDDMTNPKTDITVQKSKTEEEPKEATPAETDSTMDSSGTHFDLVGALLEYAEILAFSVAAVLLLFTLCIRLCEVDGTSMCKTLHNGEMLITTSWGSPQAGDIIVFHMTNDNPQSDLNEALVKRVIATGGQTIRIDYMTGTVSVDGQVLDEPYISLMDRSGNETGQWTQAPTHDFDWDTGIFEMTVPEGQLFVMGDNRNNSADSRVSVVGCVDERRVLGRVLLRVSPFTTDFSGED